jgi:hypothetical protein
VAGLAWCVFSTANFAYMTPEEARQLATLRTPDSRPRFQSEFLITLPSRIQDDDVLLYTSDVPFAGALWKPDLSNRVIGHSATQESLQHAVRRLRPTLVVGKPETLDKELAGIASRTLAKEETEDGLELRRILR